MKLLENCNIKEKLYEPWRSFYCEPSCLSNSLYWQKCPRQQNLKWECFMQFYTFTDWKFDNTCNFVQVSVRKKENYWGNCPLHCAKAYQDKENVTLRQKSRAMHQIAWQMIMELRASKSKMRKSDIKRTVWLMNVCRAAELAVYYVCLIRSSKLVLGEL